MGNLVSDRTADWLRDQMGRGNGRTRPRRIFHDDGGGSGDGGSCIPVLIKGRYGGQGYLGWNFAIVGKDYGRGQEQEKEPIYLPHISQSTEIPNGTCVLAHQVETVKVNGSNDD